MNNKGNLPIMPMVSGVNLISSPTCRQMRRHGSSGKRQREENAETEDDLQFVAAAAVEQEISEDTIPGTARESRVGRQPRIDPDTGEPVIRADELSVLIGETFSRSRSVVQKEWQIAKTPRAQHGMEYLPFRLVTVDWLVGVRHCDLCGSSIGII